MAPKAAGGERSFLDDIKKVCSFVRLVTGHVLVLHSLCLNCLMQMDVSRLKKKDERVLAEKVRVPSNGTVLLDVTGLLET